MDRGGQGGQPRRRVASAAGRVHDERGPPSEGAQVEGLPVQGPHSAGDVAIQGGDARPRPSPRPRPRCRPAPRPSPDNLNRNKFLPQSVERQKVEPCRRCICGEISKKWSQDLPSRVQVSE